MLYDAHEVSEGETVFLFPHTKGASTACHRQLTVKVMHDPKKHWPYVIVEWMDDGKAVWEKVHKDNIKKKPAASAPSGDKKQGDGSNVVSSGKWQRRLAAHTKAKPMALPDGMEEPTLF